MTRRCRVAALDGVVLASNRGMLELVQRLGFRLEPNDSGAMFRRAVKELLARTG